MNWYFEVRFHNTIYFSHYQVTGVKLVQSCSKHKDPGLCKLISIQLGSMAETALVSKGLRRPPISSLCRKPQLLKIDTYKLQLLHTRQIFHLWHLKCSIWHSDLMWSNSSLLTDLWFCFIFVDSASFLFHHV